VYQQSLAKPTEIESSSTEQQKTTGSCMTPSCLCYVYHILVPYWSQPNLALGPSAAPPLRSPGMERGARDVTQSNSLCGRQPTGEIYIDHAHEVPLCPQADCRRSSSFSKNSPDAPDQIADRGGLHVKGSKIGHVLSAVGRKSPHEFIPRLQSPEMNGEGKTGKGSCCGAAEVSGQWSRDRIWGGGKSRWQG
jgi:hypothetical protein